MGLLFWKKPMEAASEIVKDAAKTGMEIWDNKDFKPEERAAAFLDFLDRIKDQATSIARRQLLVAILGFQAVTLGLALIYNQFGMTEEYNGLLQIYETWKIGWAFVGVCCFYLGTHLVKGIKG